jgi:hypothetical protein
MATKDIARSITVLDDATLTKIQSFDDALKALDNAGATPELSTDYGTGFVVVNKETLLGVDMILIQWRFSVGEYGKDFVSVEAVTRRNEKVVFNDGSTGICAQLANVTASREERKHSTPQAGLMVPGGLTVSNFFYNGKTEETSKVAQSGEGWGPATVYYLAQ